MNEQGSQILYPDYDEAVALHVRLMVSLQEHYYGVASEDLLISALERPKMAAHFESADLIEQAAHILWGIIRNHPFRQGNKRTGVAIAFAFLRENGLLIVAEQDDVISLGLGVAEGSTEVSEVTLWLRSHSVPRQ